MKMFNVYMQIKNNEKNYFVLLLVLTILKKFYKFLIKCANTQIITGV